MNQNLQMTQNDTNNTNNEYHLLLDEHYQPNTRLLANPYNTNKTDLQRLGGKKKSSRVSFRNEVSVTKVENWKQFNHDVSEENEFIKLKKEIKQYKAEQAKKEKEKDKCCCEIF